MAISSWLSRRRRLNLDEEDFRDEIDVHLRMAADDHIADGAGRREAERAARKEFGNVALTTEVARDIWTPRWLTVVRDAISDVKYGLRTLRRTPAFTLAAVSTLALGIGSVTAIFSVANAVLLKPLPYPHWEDLRTVRTMFTDGKVTTGLVAPLEFSRLNDPTIPIMRSAMTYRFDAALLSADNTPRPLIAQGVSDGFFELVGLPLAIGSGFTPEYFRQGGPSAVVISHQLWRDHFASDPTVIGRRLHTTMGDEPIVGVAAAGMDLPRGTDAWYNLQLNPNATGHSFDGYFRVRPGTSAEVLKSRLQAVAEGLGRDYPGPEGHRAFVVQPLLYTMVGDLRPILLIVLSATGLLLLLACVNVTNLLLARAAGRGHEMAVRSTLGAGRGRLVRQLLAESFLLATVGGAAGLILAYGAVRALLAVGASRLPRLETMSFDWSVLLFALGILVVSAAGVGLAPAVNLARSGVDGLLRDGGRSVRGSRSTRRTMRTLITAEIAVALTLVAGAGWLMRSFTNLQDSNPGFTAAKRLTFDIALSDRYRDAAFRNNWIRALLGDLQHLNGVVSAAASSDFPLRPEVPDTTLILMDGWTESHLVARRHYVTASFFDTMGIQLRHGRAFTADDRKNTAPVAIVNESFVRKYLDGRDPLTTQMAYGFPQPNPKTRRPIVGVVNDVKYGSLWGDADAAFYLVQDQEGAPMRQSVVITTDLSDPSVLIPTIEAEVHKHDPQLPVTVTPVDSLIASALTRQKLGTTLMFVFGAMALVLAAIGIYGVVAYACAERLHEVATRMALGATPSEIFRLLAAQAFRALAVGTIVGLAMALGAGRFVAGWLYQVRPSDPAILLISILMVLTVTVFATVVPARRASRVDPALALRSD
jgi:putative ABC transport system permease protein